MNTITSLPSRVRVYLSSLCSGCWGHHRYDDGFIFHRSEYITHNPLSHMTYHNLPLISHDPSLLMTITDGLSPIIITYALWPCLMTYDLYLMTLIVTHHTWLWPITTHDFYLIWPITNKHHLWPMTYPSEPSPMTYHSQLITHEYDFSPMTMSIFYDYHTWLLMTMTVTLPSDHHHSYHTRPCLFTHEHHTWVCPSSLTLITQMTHYPWPWLPFIHHDYDSYPWLLYMTIIHDHLDSWLSSMTILTHDYQDYHLWPPLMTYDPWHTIYDTYYSWHPLITLDCHSRLPIMASHRDHPWPITCHSWLCLLTLTYDHHLSPMTYDLWPIITYHPWHSSHKTITNDHDYHSLLVIMTSYSQLAPMPYHSCLIIHALSLMPIYDHHDLWLMIYNSSLVTITSDHHSWPSFMTIRSDHLTSHPWLLTHGY